MDKRELVKRKIREVVDRIISDNGEINLFMLLPDDKEETSYTILISSSWLDVLSPYEGTKLVAEYMFNYLDENEINYISRITAMNSSDSSVTNLNKGFCLSSSILTIQDYRTFDVVIEKAIVYESKQT